MDWSYNEKKKMVNITYIVELQNGKLCKRHIDQTMEDKTENLGDLVSVKTENFDDLRNNETKLETVRQLE